MATVGVNYTAKQGSSKAVGMAIRVSIVTKCGIAAESQLVSEPVLDMRAQLLERNGAVFQHAVVEFPDVELLTQLLAGQFPEGEDLETTGINIASDRIVEIA